MKALVTGGAGYVGSNLVDALLARGEEVAIIDNLSTGRINNIRHHLDNPRFRFVNDTILSTGTLERLVEWADIVFHLAAAVGVKYIVDDPIGTITTNVRGTENVLAMAYRYWKRVVIASTSEVYGKSNGGSLKEDDDRLLGPTTINRWAYSASKAIDEHFAYAYFRGGLPVSIVRYFNSYGPRVNEAGYGSVIANFARQALTDQPITVHGDGSQTRCFTYVEDTVRGTMLAGERTEVLGEAFNIGSEQEVTILELARMIRDLCESQSEITCIPYRDYYGHSYEDTPRRRPDMEKSRTLLQFQAEVPLEEGLRRTIAWCRKNYELRRPVGSR
jgi:nucleoside-diphosphate-sugar epimerase